MPKKRLKGEETERYGATIKDAAYWAGIPVEDAFQLAGIELACEVADEFAVTLLAEARPGVRARNLPPDLRSVLDRLEAATRGSALRKVKL